MAALQAPLAQTLTYSSALTWDWSLGNFAILALSGDCSLSLSNVPTDNTGVGVLQCANNGHDLSLPGNTDNVSINPSAVNYLTFWYVSGTITWFSSVSVGNPLPPTNLVFDSTANTLTWTPNPAYPNANQYEYTLDTTTTPNVFTPATSFTIDISTVFLAAGQFGVRVKLSGSNKDSTLLTNASSWIPTDNDVTAFLNANGVTDANYKKAVTKAVMSLKDANLWSALRFMQISWDSFNQSKYNLKNPLEMCALVGTDGAFSKGFVANSTGNAGPTDGLLTPYKPSMINGGAGATIMATVISDYDGASRPYILGPIVLTNPFGLDLKEPSTLSDKSSTGYFARLYSNGNSGASVYGPAKTRRFWATVNADSICSYYANNTKFFSQTADGAPGDNYWIIGSGAQESMTSTLKLGIVALMDPLTDTQQQAADAIMQQLCNGLSFLQDNSPILVRQLYTKQ